MATKKPKKKAPKTMEARIREKAHKQLKREIDNIFSVLYTADVLGERSIPLPVYRKNSTTRMGTTEVIEILKATLFKRDKTAAADRAVDNFIGGCKDTIR